MGRNAKANIHYINIGPCVLAVAFIILLPTFSLFPRNIWKLYSAICVPARLQGMPLLLPNQFLTCSAGASILPGKNSVTFISIQFWWYLVHRQTRAWSYSTLILPHANPGKLTSLGKRSIITVFVHLAEAMKKNFVSLWRYWWKRYINNGN